MGYRYEFPQQESMDSLVIMSEATEFKMPRIHKSLVDSRIRSIL
ncbi:glycoside hydrolase family 97 N-terminal domain-containing protein [Bacteroides ovatus]|nr:glycoside hydrolase family 97 N-terminal domain-containing protein [Bacteroides ovatus]